MEKRMVHYGSQTYQNKTSNIHQHPKAELCLTNGELQQAAAETPSGSLVTGMTPAPTAEVHDSS